MLGFSVLLDASFIGFDRTGTKVWLQAEHRMFFIDVMTLPSFWFTRVKPVIVYMYFDIWGILANLV